MRFTYEFIWFWHGETGQFPHPVLRIKYLLAPGRSILYARLRVGHMFFDCACSFVCYEALLGFYWGKGDAHWEKGMHFVQLTLGKRDAFCATLLFCANPWVTLGSESNVYQYFSPVWHRRGRNLVDVRKLRFLTRCPTRQPYLLLIQKLNIATTFCVHELVA